MMTNRPVAFPKPILAAIRLLRQKDVARWLLWRYDAVYGKKLELCLITRREHRDSQRCIWSTWHSWQASDMTVCLAEAGHPVANAHDFNLSLTTSNRWYVPDEAQP